MGGFLSRAELADPMRRGYDLERSLQAAADVIAKSSSMTAFTGAGISVESGIPDFRSPGGLWSKYDPRIYCEYNHFCEQPHLFWQMGRELALEVHLANQGELHLQEGLKEAEPNAAHRALVELETRHLHDMCRSFDRWDPPGYVLPVATSKPCQGDYRAHLSAQDRWVPRHPETNGVLKPDITMFGEALPAGALAASWGVVLGSPVCLVVGTGLNVAPANMVPGLVKWRFGTLIILNKDTSGASDAHIFLQGSAGEILPRLVQEVRKKMGLPPSEGLFGRGLRGGDLCDRRARCGRTVAQRGMLLSSTRSVGFCTSPAALQRLGLCHGRLGRCSWIQLPPMRTVRWAAAACCLPDHVAFVAGGYGEEALADVECLVFGAPAWRPVPSLLTPRAAHTMAALGGKLYVAGGYGPQERPLRSIERFDPSMGFWEARACSCSRFLRLNAPQEAGDWSPSVRRCTAHLHDLSLLRGTTSEVLLNRFGRILKSTTGGVDTVAGDEPDDYSKKLDIFLSHSWQACWWMKYLTLLYYFNALPATLSVIVMAIIWCTLQAHVHCQEGLWDWRWRGFLPTSLVFFAVLFSWHHLRAKNCSRTLLVAWDRSYFSRLWCTFELAAFFHSQPEGKVICLPIILGRVTTEIALCSWGLELVRVFVDKATRNLFAFLVSLAVATRFHDFLEEVDELSTALKDFEARRAEILACDRQLVEGSIAHWYGRGNVEEGLRRFDALIRGPFRERIREVVRGARMPYHLILLASECAAPWPRGLRCAHIMFLGFPLVFAVLMSIMRRLMHVAILGKCTRTFIFAIANCLLHWAPWGFSFFAPVRCSDVFHTVKHRPDEGADGPLVRSQGVGLSPKEWD
eukprot:g3827.t1